MKKFLNSFSTKQIINEICFMSFQYENTSINENFDESTQHGWEAELRKLCDAKYIFCYTKVIGKKTTKIF